MQKRKRLVAVRLHDAGEGQRARRRSLKTTKGRARRRPAVSWQAFVDTPGMTTNTDRRLHACGPHCCATARQTRRHHAPRRSTPLVLRSFERGDRVSQPSCAEAALWPASPSRRSRTSGRPASPSARSLGVGHRGAPWRRGAEVSGSRPSACSEESSNGGCAREARTPHRSPGAGTRGGAGSRPDPLSWKIRSARAYVQEFMGHELASAQPG
jgi:hypothetical protein